MCHRVEGRGMELKSQGNIFCCTEGGQARPNPKLAQEREPGLSGDPRVVCTEQCQSFNYKIALPRATAETSGLVEISTLEAGGGGGGGREVKIEKGALIDLSTVRW